MTNHSIWPGFEDVRRTEEKHRQSGAEVLQTLRERRNALASIRGIEQAPGFQRYREMIEGVESTVVGRLAVVSEPVEFYRLQGQLEVLKRFLSVFDSDELEALDRRIEAAEAQVNQMAERVAPQDQTYPRQ